MNNVATKRGFDGNGISISRRQLVYWAAFYLGIPVALALYAGASESGSATFIAKRYYFYYSLAAGLPSWWVIDISTRIINRVLKPWGPPLVVVLILGAIAGLNIQGTWAPFRQSLFEPYLAAGSQFYSVFPWRFGDPDYVAEALIAWTTISIVWVSANLFFIHLLDFPRFGYKAASRGDQPKQAAAEPAPAPELPTQPVAAVNLLLDKLPKDLGKNIIALKAEEHYTQVYTDKGASLILMRFSDAVGMLGEVPGVQTHRSYWVNSDYVSELVRDGRSSHVHLTTGIDIPVSRSYRVKVKEALEDRLAT